MKCGVVVLVALAFSGCGGSEPLCRGFHFNAATWNAPRAAAGHPGELTVRQRIADRMVACRTLVGRPRAEVRRMLGKPFYKGEDGWYWDIGPERSLGLDRQQLVVVFDGHGHVIRTELGNF